jgi:hypothetical protein
MKQTPRLLKSELTDIWYIVTKYKDLGNGHFRAIEKFEIIKEDLEAIRKK